MSLVLDSSATLAWIFSDGTTKSIRRLFDAGGRRRRVCAGAVAAGGRQQPEIAVRRGRIDANLRRASLADLALLDITTDHYADFHAWGETVNLADRFKLTIYDAAYLELALRHSLPLATLDDELRAAATALGLRLLGAD